MHSRDGQSLVLTSMVVAILTVLGGALLGEGLTAANHLRITQLQTEAFYLAQGAVEEATGQFVAALRNYQITATETKYPAVGTLTTTFAPSARFPVGATASSVVTEIQPGQTTVTAPDGVQELRKVYEIVTTVQHPLNAGVQARLHQMITRTIRYTFQHAIFYDQDLEWLPGPNMTLTGRVHSNRDIYLGANSTLTADTTYLKAAGNLYNRRKDNGASMPGTVQIRKTGTSGACDATTCPAVAGLDSSSSTWANDATTRWNGTVQTSAHGVTALEAPEVGSITPGGYYDGQASLHILNGTVTENGTPLTEGPPGVGNMPVGTVATTTSLYNNREGKWVKMTEIDLKKLAGWADCDSNPGTPDTQCYTNHLPSNGLVYATRDDVAATYQPGVRLTNGTEIYRAGGLTLVTNLPMYIKGDYNTVNKKPTAVMADAVNLLSNGWNDSKSNQSLSNRVASNTTVNTAFLAGIDPTAGSQYSGGLENYPRLHETWSGKTITIRGSFVSLWNSQIALGNWVYGAPQYNAPTRNWDYDTSFSTGQLPPFTPWAVGIIDGAWWKE